MWFNATFANAKISLPEKLANKTGPCITTAMWRCRTPISQWQHSFHLKAALPLVKRLASMSVSSSNTGNRFGNLAPMDAVKNTMNSGGREWKHILDHQGWVQKLPRTKENYRNRTLCHGGHTETVPRNSSLESCFTMIFLLAVSSPNNVYKLISYNNQLPVV